MPRLLPTLESESAILDRLAYFTNIGLWQKSNGLPDPRRWLANFSPEEKNHAISLLASLCLYSGQLVDALFLGAFSAISARLDVPVGSERDVVWDDYRNRVIVTYVDSPASPATDSGILFTRRARDLLGLRDQQIAHPDAALLMAIASPERPLLIVDDFVGTGDQFIGMWIKQRELGGGVLDSFAAASRSRPSTHFLCSLFCTEHAINRFRDAAFAVEVSAAHTLKPEEGTASPNSVQWPQSLKPTAAEFIAQASSRAGIELARQLGTCGEGYLIAFQHGVPDATLPLFYASSPGWNPLIRRSSS